MKLPSIQLLNGVLDPKSEYLSAVKEIGLGRPEKDTATTIFGREATILRGDYALSVNSPDMRFDGSPWTIQFYGKIQGAFVYLSSFNYPNANKEFSLVLSPSTFLIYLTSEPGVVNIVSEAEIDPKYRGGFRHYKVTYALGKLSYYIDGKIIAAVNINLAAPSSGFTLLGQQRGKADTLVTGAKVYAELFRLDWGYVVPVGEDFKFIQQSNLDVARSFFDESQVGINQFNLMRITDVFNYAKEPNLAEIDASKSYIPQMTAATVGDITVSASSIFGDAFPARYAFMQYPPSASAIAWVSGNSAASNVNPHYLTVVNTKKMRFNAYRIADRFGGSGKLYSWVLQGKNAADATWTDIHTVTNDVSSEPVRRYMDFPTAEFEQVRLKITKHSVADIAQYAAVGHFQLLLVETKASKKAFRYSDGSFTITDTPTNPKVGNHITEVRRKNTIGITFNKYEVVNRVWAGDATTIQSPNSWILQGRNSTSDTWTDIHSVSGSTLNTSGGARSFVLDKPYSFKYIRLYITATNGTNIFTSVGELRLLLDDVLATPAMLTNIQAPYEASASSFYTANGTYPAYMAFNHSNDPGWVAAAKATSGSPQWVQLFADIQGKELEVLTSDNKILNAGTIVDINPPWIYPQGNGYLIDDNGTLKFVPFTVTGLTETLIGDKPYYVFPMTTSVPMSPENLGSVGYEVDNNVSYNPGFVAGGWKTLPFNIAALNGQPLTVTNGTFTLPAGKYFGRLLINGYKCNSFVAKLRDGNNATLALTPAAFSDNGFTGIANLASRVYLDLITDTVVSCDVFAEAVTTASTSATVMFSTKQTIASLNLFRVG